MRYIPVHTNILVKLVEEEEKQIISSVKADIVKGHVQEIGEGKKDNGIISPMLVRPDSFVWFKKSHAIQIPEEIGKDLFVLNQDDIILMEEDGNGHN